MRFITRLILLSFLFSLISIMAVSNTGGSGSSNVEDAMRLVLTIHANELSVKISNSSSDEIRLWELENSWGWDSISLHLKKESDAHIYVIKRAVRDWTKNGPYFFTLSSGETREIFLNIKDEWWEWSQDISALRDQPILVRAQLSVISSSEAEKHGVFLGDVVSDWILAAPPHPWLF